MGSFTMRVQGAESRYDSAAAEASAVLATGRTRVWNVIMHNGNAATRYLLLFDAAALPANGTVPDAPPLQIPADGTGSLDLGDGSLFLNGLVAASSTTAQTLTIGSADAIFFANYSKRSIT